MWAQLTKIRVDPRSEERLRQVMADRAELLRGVDTGWVRSLTFRDAKDQHVWYGLVVYESEEQARVTERMPETQEWVGRLRDLMEGPPEFQDLILVEERER